MLNAMDRRRDISPSGSQIADTPPDFFAHIVGRAVREHQMRIDAAAKGYPVTELPFLIARYRPCRARKLARGSKDRRRYQSNRQ